MRVLFIGNSHTYYNDMPHLFAQICREKGIDTEVTMLAHGGKGWDFHLEEPEVKFNIEYGGYDAVILQHKAHPMGDLSVMQQCGKELIRRVQEAGAKRVVLEAPDFAVISETQVAQLGTKAVAYGGMEDD